MVYYSSGDIYIAEGVLELGTIAPTTEKSKLVSQHIRKLVHLGQYTSGQRLPTERTLAERFGVNHLTVRRGLQMLVKEGLIYKRPYVGSFVKETTMPAKLAIILPTWMFENGENHHPSTGLFFGGIAQGLDQNHYSAITLSYRTEHFWADAGQLAMAHNVRGVLLRGSPDIKREDVQRLLDEGIQVSLLSFEPQLAPLGLDWIGLDVVTILAQTVDKLIEIGHRHILVCFRAGGRVERSERERVLRAVCDDSGVKVRCDMVDVPVQPYDDSVLAEQLDRPDRPTAIISPGEIVTGSLFRLCYERNLRIPQDLSLAALQDNTPHVHAVPLTAPDTVAMYTKVAAMLAERLVKKLSGEDVPNCNMRLHCEIHWRESVAPLPGHDRKCLVENKADADKKMEKLLSD